ncbi:MAG: signal peptidase I [Holophagaceae bacterium]|nr:signal peptidase I [Holophagaceae bacterium]
MEADGTKDLRTLPAGVARGVIRDNLELACFGVAMILFFKTFVGQQFVIPSASMRNTMMIGDHLLANKFIFATPQWGWEAKLFPMRKVDRGDIIVFRYPMDRNMDYVKRCVALPGDKLEIRRKHLYVNGKLVTGEFEHHILNPGKGPVEGPWPEGADMGLKDPDPSPGIWPFLDPEIAKADMQGHAETYGFSDNLGPVTVPPGCIFGLGDNRDRSADSRFWGFIPQEQLRGRPFIVWWSFREGGSDDTRAKEPAGPGDVVMNFMDGTRHFFTWTRWERTGTIPR